MKIRLTSVFVDDQDKALKVYTEVLGFVENVVFRMEPTQMGPTMQAVLDDTCGNLLQLYQPSKNDDRTE